MWNNGKYTPHAVERTTEPDPDLGRIDFAENWNRKLYCDCFTTIRRASHKYKQYARYNLFFKGLYIGQVIVLQVQTFPLGKLPPITATLDTGCSPQQTRQIFQFYYPDVTDTTEMMLLLLQFTHRCPPTQ